MQHIRTLVPSQRLYPVTALFAGVIVLLAIWPAPKTSPRFDARCESWDTKAGVVFAGLIADRGATAEASLGDALFRLKRARKYCRHGFVSLARVDYDVLLGNRYQIGR